MTAKGKKDGYAVVLDQTAFFPEGGGQFGDRGFIDDVEVYDTHRKKAVSFFTIQRCPWKQERRVSGKAGFSERFSRMRTFR